MKALLQVTAGAGVILLAAVLVLLHMPIAHAGATVCGTISYYGTESGSRTSTGDYFDGTSMTMAVPHRSMIGKRYRVTNAHNGRSVVVWANDYGPRADLHRIGDVSKRVAELLGFVRAGTTRACLSIEGR